MRKRIVDNRKPLVISLVFVLIALCILFYLTFQTPDDTVALSEGWVICLLWKISLTGSVHLWIGQYVNGHMYLNS